MDIFLHTDAIRIPSGMRDELLARIRQAFGRHQDGVTRVHVTLRDLNGPRGGRDKFCMLRVQLEGGSHFRVMNCAARIDRALNRSLRRAKRMTAARRLRQRLQGRRSRRGELMTALA